MEKALKLQLELFSTAVLVSEYALRRLVCREATTKAENNNVDPVAIVLINRWRKKEGTREAKAGLSTRQVYTQVSRAIKAVLRFSQSH